MFFLKQKVVILVVLSLGFIFYCFATPVYALNNSKRFTVALFVSGIGLKVAGVLTEKSAQEAFDKYLYAGVQAEISRYRDNYDRKHLRSLIMSRAGTGLTGLAVLLAIRDQLRMISAEQSSPSEPGLSFKPSYDVSNQTAVFMVNWRF